MRISKRVFLILLIIMLVMSVVPKIVTADTLDPVAAMSSLGNDFTDPQGADKAKGVLNAAIGVVQVAGTGIALIMASMLGIKYMLAAPNEKADAKKQIFPLLIGAILLFGSVNIVQIVANFTADTFK